MRRPPRDKLKGLKLINGDTLPLEELFFLRLVNRQCWVLRCGGRVDVPTTIVLTFFRLGLGPWLNR
jgi:hypothetical protein